MNAKYRVVIADFDPTSRETLRDCLTNAGHDVIGCAHSVEQAAKLSRELAPDLVIVDLALTQTDGRCALSQIVEARESPILAIADHVDDQAIEEANASRVFGFLVKPIRQQELVATISVAVKRFDEFCQLREEASSLRNALDDRKVIERAKGFLMKNRSMDEESAFRHMQLLARSHRLKLVDVAKSVLIANEAFQDS
jgi:two-component system, response regulator PdtaR